ncbi:MAG: hypothetical protein ACKPKO_18775, partial [Candidatus Fonsibacter sp.]
MFSQKQQNIIAETPTAMTDWPNEWDLENEGYDALAVDERQPQGLQFTPPKVAPSFDGQIYWFAFAEAIYDWLDITNIAPPDKWAPSLKSIQVGYASIL